MATTKTKAQVEVLIKTLYHDPKKIAEQVIMRTSPLLAKLHANADFASRDLRVPVTYSAGTSAGASYSAVVSGAGLSKDVEFVLNYVKSYDMGRIDRLAAQLLGSNGVHGKTGLKNKVKREVDMKLKTTASTVASRLFRTSAGDIGQIHADSDTSTTTLKFASPGDAYNVNLGDSILFAATRDGAVRSSTALTVSARDGSTGEVTLSATPDSLSASIAAGDYVFLSTTCQNAGTAPAMTGLADWIPLTAPTGSLHGVNRLLDVDALSGFRVPNSTGVPIQEKLGRALAVAQNRGANPDVAVCNPVQMNNLINQIGTNVRQTPGGQAVAGFRSVIVDMGGGSLELIGDPFCQVDRAYVLDLSTFQLVSVGQLPHIKDDDGILQRSTYAGEDSLEFEIAAYYNLLCFAPGKNGVVALDPPTWY